MQTKIIESVSALVRPVYICRNCGSAGVGEKHRVEAASVEELFRVCHTHNQARFMPVGWASYFPGGFGCPKCQP